MNKNETLDTLGKRLSFLRKTSNTTQQTLATSINVARSNLTKYEQDKVKPTSDIIVNICEYFNISSDWLLRGIMPQENSITATNPALKEMFSVLEYVMADPDPDVHAWAKIQFKKAFAEYYEILGLNKSKRRSSKSTNIDEDAAAIHGDESNIA